MKEAFASLLVSSILTFFSIVFLYVFDVFQDKINTAITLVVALVLHAMFFTITLFLLNFKSFGP